VKVSDVAGSDAGRDDAMRMCAMWWRRWRWLVSTIDVAQGKGSRSSENDWPRDNSYTTRGIQPSKICIHIVTREYATPISF
jgi:hypothetical protein